MKVNFHFGNVQSIRGECREARGATFGEATLQDIRFGLRMIAKNPGFSAVIILTLGLGIGANTAIFSVVNAVLLRPLPYPAPEQLVQVQKRWHPPWLTGPEVTTMMYAAETLAWMEENQVFSQMAAYERQDMNLTGADQAERVKCGKVSLSFLPLLGAALEQGRSFLPEEDRPGGPAVAVLSHGLWQRNFGGDTNILGRTIRLDQQSYTVVGVLGSTFHFTDKYTDKYDLLVPLALGRTEGGIPEVIGRLKPGVSLEQARLALDAIYKRAGDPEEKGRVLLVGLREYVVGDIKDYLLIFQGAVGLVLLIACANVANLLLARAATRRKEIAIRVALGARRLRIIRQLLTESVLLAALGGLLGLLLTFWSKGLLQYCFTIPSFLGGPPALRSLRVGVPLDGWVLAFTLLLALGSGLLFGIAPALETSRLSVNEWLKEGTRSATGGLHRHRLSKLLGALEVAVTLVLLVSAGLLLQSFVRLQGVNLGFRPERLLTAKISLAGPQYPGGPSGAAYFEQVLERLRTLPGVEAVGANNMLPMSRMYGAMSNPEIEGHPSAFAGGPKMVFLPRAKVNSDYFRSMGIPLLKGRCFTDGDRTGAPPVVVVNEAFVRRFFPQEEPLDRRLRQKDKEWKTIVGVVGDVRGIGVAGEEGGRGPASEAEPQLYTSYLQEGGRAMSLAIRTRGEPMKLAPAVRSVIQSVDGNQPAFDLKTMEQRIADHLSSQRGGMLLSSILAVLALGLATLGIHGVLSYSVAQRTHEIGVRMALGARVADVLRLVIGQGLRTILFGVVVGWAAAFGLTRFLRFMLYGVTHLDPSTFVVVSLFLGVVTLVACYLPARKAAQVDPIVALRCE